MALFILTRPGMMCKPAMPLRCWLFPEPDGQAFLFQDSWLKSHKRKHQKWKQSSTTTSKHTLWWEKKIFQCWHCEREKTQRKESVWFFQTLEVHHARGGWAHQKVSTSGRVAGGIPRLKDDRCSYLWYPEAVKATCGCSDSPAKWTAR